MNNDERSPYVVLPGVKHGKNREYAPGDVVMLTEKEAKPLLGFKVRLQPTVEQAKEQEPSDEQEPKKPEQPKKKPGRKPKKPSQAESDAAEAAKLVKESEGKESN